MPRFDLNEGGEAGALLPFFVASLAIRRKNARSVRTCSLIKPRVRVGFHVLDAFLQRCHATDR
jgi:hypothetical protein